MAPNPVSRAYRILARRSACLGLAGAAAALPIPAYPMPGDVHFDIAAQPLESALVAYTRTTGLAVLVRSGLTAGRRGQAVQGRYEPADALERLLAGTGLEVRYSSKQAFTLVAPAGDRGQAADVRATGDGTARRQLMAYAGVVQATLMRSLCHWQPHDLGRYRASLQMWINRAGTIGRVNLLATTGDKARDHDIESRLRGLVMDRPPPAGLPQPLTIILTPAGDQARTCGLASGS